MSVLGAHQTGQDGTGQELTVNANSVTIRSKEVTAIRQSTLRITGKLTGATYAIDMIVRPGDPSLEFYPPPVDPDPPSGPVASFTHQIIDLEF